MFQGVTITESLLGGAPERRRRFPSHDVGVTTSLRSSCYLGTRAIALERRPNQTPRGNHMRARLTIATALIAAEIVLRIVAGQISLAQDKSAPGDRAGGP